MKIKNTTDFADHFLRRMTSWCATQIGLPPSHVRLARFTKYRRGYRGCALHVVRSITMRIGPAESISKEERIHRGVSLAVPDRTAALVYVTAHELGHLDAWRTGTDPGLRASRDLEPHMVRTGKRVMLTFLADREQLEATWSLPSTRARTPKPSITEQRAQVAAAALGRWQRKLKLAQTKVRRLKARVRYYDRRAACRPEGEV